VIPAVVYCAVEMAGPGHVRHHGRGELVIGASAASKEIVAAFGAAGVSVEISENVAGSALGQAHRQQRVQRALGDHAASLWTPGRECGVPAIMGDVVDECLAVARAAGVQGARRHARGRAPHRADHAGQYSSTAQDLAKQKKPRSTTSTASWCARAKRSACARR
jgi:2-dehydropantoate 2-reductase